jgi:hypothetical protein
LTNHGFYVNPNKKAYSSQLKREPKAYGGLLQSDDLAASHPKASSRFGTHQRLVIVSVAASQQFRARCANRKLDFRASS